MGLQINRKEAIVAMWLVKWLRHDYFEKQRRLCPLPVARKQYCRVRLEER